MAEPGEFVGAVIGGKYALKRLIGEGGMGAVFEGTHLEIGKRVAVKVVAAELAKSEEVERRFRREARAASVVESEHIVQVFDAGRDDRVGLYMVMEYLVGEDLGQRLARTGPLAVDAALEIACQALRGLFKAHSVGIVHRDLKPANLFLTSREDGSLLVKLVDFGVSKVLQDAKCSSIPPQGPALTRMGSAIGTPQYMSPEQAQGLPTVDHRSDIWSLGAVLYEVLSGTAPYEEMPTYEQTIIRIVTQRPKPLKDAAPWVTAPLATVIDQMLVHDPEQRIALGAALRAMLELRASLAGADPARYPQPSNPDWRGSSPEWNGPTVQASAPAVVRREPHTSAAVVLGPAASGSVPEDGEPPPRVSDLPGVGSSRKAVAIGAAAIALAAVVALTAWVATRARSDITTVVAASGSAVWAATPPLSAATAVPDSSQVPPVVVVDEAPVDASTPEPSSSAEVRGTKSTGAGREREPKRAEPVAKEGGSKGASNASKDVIPEDTAAKKPPPAPTQYGGVGVSDSY